METLVALRLKAILITVLLGNYDLLCFILLEGVEHVLKAQHRWDLALQQIDEMEYVVSFWNSFTI